MWPLHRCTSLFRPFRQRQVLSADRHVSRSVEPTPPRVDSFQHSSPDTQYCARSRCFSLLSSVSRAHACPRRSSHHLHLSFWCHCSLGQAVSNGCQDEPKSSAKPTKVSTLSREIHVNHVIHVKQVRESRETNTCVNHVVDVMSVTVVRMTVARQSLNRAYSVSHQRKLRRHKLKGP